MNEFERNLKKAGATITTVNKLIFIQEFEFLLSLAPNPLLFEQCNKPEDAVMLSG
jgi:hypothetical protein